MQWKAVSLSVAVGGLIAGAYLMMPATSHAQQQYGDSRVQIGLAIAPVPLNLKGKDVGKVGLGSYLVNAVAGCNDCHTWRVDPMNPNGGSNYEVGGDPYVPGQTEKIYVEGYLAGGRPFGPFTSRNITPDKTGQVADGYATFKEIMRHGTDPDKFITPILQVMPWPIYRNLSEQELQAIYEYLTAIPCREGTPGEPGPSNTHRCPGD